MNSGLVAVAFILGALLVVIGVLIYKRFKQNTIQFDNRLSIIEKNQERSEKLLLDQLAVNRSEISSRLTESFKLVNDQLQQVYKGLGEMQDLARGVGDLKKLLSNVKTRGGWGEIQLEALLEQILAPEQYRKNVKVNPESGEVVEFAIKLPGHGNDEQKPVWLPIDAKFPREDYERLLESSEKGDVDGINAAAAEIEKRIKEEAKSISKKYICPPFTTDFAIMFIPIEGLYSEMLRRAGLVDFIQREYRVNIAGPTTFAALLNSLQMGFRTLAIEKRSSEVWELLSVIKFEFEKFEEVIDKVHGKVQEVNKIIEDDIARRTRIINRKLNNVQSLPLHASESQNEGKI